MAPEEARRAALRTFGNALVVLERLGLAIALGIVRVLMAMSDMEGLEVRMNLPVLAL